MRVTKKAALAWAKSLHGAVHQVTPGPRGYGHVTYSEKYLAWWAPQHTGYYRDKVRDRARSVRAYAAAAVASGYLSTLSESWREAHDLEKQRAE